MKVILLRDVAKIGKRYEVVIVPDGFALNKLIPQRDAQPATPVNIKRVANMRQKSKSDKEGILVNLAKITTDLGEEPLVVPMSANDQGHLFKSVHVDDVVNSASLRGVKIPKEFVVLQQPIKSVGEHQVELKSQGKTFPLIIKVVTK